MPGCFAAGWPKRTVSGRIALIVTRNGLAVSAYEDDPAWMDDPRFTRYDNDDLFGAPASGSSSFDAMVVIPFDGHGRTYCGGCFERSWPAAPQM